MKKPPPAEKLNLTDVLTLLVSEISRRVELFSHVDAGRVLVCLSTNRSNGRGGTYGKLVPLRFKGGSEALRHRGARYRMPRVMCRGVEQFYIVYFYYPKFFDLTPVEKLRVIFHELYHISPDFSGDIRRLGRVKCSHGRSRKNFDSLFEGDLALFYRHIARTPYMRFLEMDTAMLRKVFPRMIGRRLKMPRPASTGPDQNV